MRRFRAGRRELWRPGFRLNKASTQAKDLSFWLPGHRASASGLADYGPNKFTPTFSSFEEANLATNGFGGPAYNFNAGGASDGDSIQLAADPRLAIQSNSFSFAVWCNIRSYGLGSFADFGRIFYKGGGVDFRFDAETGSFGAGAGVRILLDRSTSGTGFRKAAGPASLVPLNTNMLIVLTHDGNVAHAGTHIYINDVELTYTASVDGTGAFTDDSGTGIYMGDRSAGDRLADGLFWGWRLYIGRQLSRAEVSHLYAPRSRHDLYELPGEDWDIEDASGIAPSVLSAAGAGVGSFTGFSLRRGVWVSAGLVSPSLVGRSRRRGDILVAGTATVDVVGNSLGVISSDGQAVASLVGRSRRRGDADAVGAATVSFAGLTVKRAILSSMASASPTIAGQSRRRGDASADGAATVSFEGRSKRGGDLAVSGNTVATFQNATAGAVTPGGSIQDRRRRRQ